MRKHAIISQMEDELGVLTWPAGSRYTVDPEPEGRDYDWIVFTPNEDRLNVWLTSCAFEKLELNVEEDYEGNLTTPWVWFDGDDKINLIVTPDMPTVNRWIEARDFCKKHNVQSREDRIAIHRFFRYRDSDHLLPGKYAGLVEFEPATPSLDKPNEIN